MSGQNAYFATDVFDGNDLHDGRALLVSGGKVDAVIPVAEIPVQAARIDLGPGTICPGFVDLQVNGGDGVMFNDAPSVETLSRISKAHARLGTAALLPTLITDTPARTAAAIAAAGQAIAQGIPGIIGLHLEGPHLSVARKGAHDPALIRPMDDADLDRLCRAAQALPTLMVTVAAETVSPEQIAAMDRAGIIVSLGHSDAGHATCMAAIKAGARCATHLFNAMSPLSAREPGLVGATLGGGINAGLIADGIHVHPATIATALRARQGPGEIFLVTDAMATAGSDIDRFTLNGRQISRHDGRLTLADGTLAGADLEMAQALKVMTDQVGLRHEDALRMATSAPARAIRRYPNLGSLTAGGPAHFLHLAPELTLKGTWFNADT